MMHERGVCTQEYRMCTCVCSYHRNKCYSWALVQPHLGGSRDGTGNPSRAEGHLVAFGGTEEYLRWANAGVKARDSGGLVLAYDRATGKGRVKAHDGDYADAQSKGFGFTLLVSESSGAVNGALDATLRRNAKLARAPGTKDFTQYGEARASPKDYYRHHLAAHCSAVVYADAAVLLNEAANLGYGLVRGEFG